MTRLELREAMKDLSSQCEDLWRDAEEQNILHLSNGFRLASSVLDAAIETDIHDEQGMGIIGGARIG